MVSGDLSRKQPWVIGITQPWASEQIEGQHTEALYLFGEPCLFTMMWRAQDFEAGLVDHCHTCYDRSAQAFRQAADSHCPDCFGTIFEGGVRAQILRPAIFADRNIERVDTIRGTVQIDQPMLETTGDFLMLKGDYVFRSDGTRYQTEQKGEAMVRTGHDQPGIGDSFRGTIPMAHLEDPTSPAYIIPPDTDDLITLLQGALTNPVDDIGTPGALPLSTELVFVFTDLDTWVVNHMLSILVPGTVVITDMDDVAMLNFPDYATIQQLVVRWPSPTSGKVYVKR